ncbi:hypothetical protein N7509_003974 [Penicillium cosmopolitanum]|uniref:Uncharacterized protein n=1 Tax=Penicillium cosmopolitanum TaxID=1131564 RepID=A0A9W9W608_9EURO|nr:uncharacterized protein N7509_003974 [Penicillium cosmopolitanum]KAJ5404103.1 hypothetical protein N7509_003974 [Penicillium cosmopolitanum]
MNDQRAILPHEGLRQRRDQRTRDVSQGANESETTDVKLFLIVCFPHHSRRKMWQTKITEVNDHGLMRRVKKTYHHLRPFWRRLGELRGFSSIRLARFELSHTKDGPLVNDIEWKWPKTEDTDWESIRDDSEGTPVDGISKLMVHLWLSQGKPHDYSHSNKNSEITCASNSTGKKRRIPRIEICGPWTSQTLPVEERHGSIDDSHWINRIRSVRIYFPTDSEARRDIPEVDEEIEEWLQTASVDVDLGEVDPHYIFQRTPKKRRQPLGIDPNGRNAPIGWASCSFL